MVRAKLKPPKTSCLINCLTICFTKPELKQQKPTIEPITDIAFQHSEVEECYTSSGYL